MEIDTEDVLYMQCPHCGKGWYGRVKSYELEYFRNADGSISDEVMGPFGNMYLKNYIVEGLNDTDVTEELTCLNCGGKYTPINKIAGPTNGTTSLMWEFVAHGLTTVTGK